MTAQEFIHFIWICEPKKGAIEVSDVIEAMELYHAHKLEGLKGFKNKYLSKCGENDKDVIDKFVSLYLKQNMAWFVRLSKN